VAGIVVINSFSFVRQQIQNPELYHLINVKMKLVVIIIITLVIAINDGNQLKI